MKDRLYLREEVDDEDYEEGELIYPLQGERIVVLSLQGETLQVSCTQTRVSSSTISAALTASCWRPSETGARALMSAR